MGGGPTETWGGIKGEWALEGLRVPGHGLGCPAATGGLGVLCTCPVVADEPARVTPEQREEGHRKLVEHLEWAAQQRDWFQGGQVVGIAVDMPYHVRTEGHTADCECPKCEPGRWE